MGQARHSWLGPAVLTGALSPLAVLGLHAARGTLPANPVAYVLNQLGLLALICLVASLACTPLRLVFHWGWPVPLRRLLGLLGFMYASLHALCYVAIDQGFALGVVLEDVLERPFIAVGVLAFVCLVPLALTSTAKSVKQLGAKRWRRIHQLAYVASTLAVVHFLLRVKADLTEPLVYGAVLFLLFVIRWANGRRTRHRSNVVTSNG